MENKKSNHPVTRSEFLKEAHCIRKEVKEKTQALQKEIERVDNKVDTLDTKVNKIAVELLQTSTRLQRVEENMATKEDVNKILNAIDNFTLKTETYDRKAIVHDHRIKEAESELQNHETRIAHLENISSK